MNAEERDRLDAAYRGSTYFVDGPAGRFALRIGQASREADALAEVHRSSTWTYITAYNPGSIAATSEQNEKQQQELQQALTEAKYLFYRGEGKGDDGWPAEASFMVLGVSETAAAALAGRFGQTAVLFGAWGKPVRLLWTGAATTSLIGEA